MARNQVRPTPEERISLQPRSEPGSRGRESLVGVTFLTGFAAGLSVCVLLGHVVGNMNIYPDFVRFNQYLNALTVYFPTASEVRALVKARCPVDRVLVVVGGNSVFYGAGQRAEEIWTSSLQAKLGDGFCVVNLAVPRSLIGDFGAVTVNMLWRDYPRALLVDSTLAAVCGPPDGDPFYRYLYWDAYWKGLLTFPDAVPRPKTPSDDDQ